MPDRLPACRLYIRTLLRNDDFAKAAALIAPLVLKHPSDPSLALLQARSCARQGQYTRAARELDLALTARPEHGPTLELAARIARRLGRTTQAVTHLETAVRLRPGHRRRRELYLLALVAAGDTAEAVRLMRRWDDVSPLMHARIYVAQGRLLDAAELLEFSSVTEADPRQRDRMLAERIELLERLGDVERLRRTIECIEPDQPASLLQAGRAWLSLGDFVTAARVMARLARRPRYRRRALHVMLVAATLAGRQKLSVRVLGRLQSLALGVNENLLVDCWRRGLRGRLVHTRYEARGGNANEGLLRPLLRQAIGSLDEALSADPEGPEHVELIRHRSVCLAAMGRSAGLAARSGLTGDAGHA
jgi:tetratricopeptide (TPR) repeat protein